MSTIVKRHRCGTPDNVRTHTASEWPTLDLVGYAELTDETDAEMRNCRECGSTIAIEVARGAR